VAGNGTNQTLGSATNQVTIGGVNPNLNNIVVGATVQALILCSLSAESEAAVEHRLVHCGRWTG
jgi:hypothetical protein